MINLTGTPLSDTHIKLLSKGLSFSPTNTPNDFDIKIDLFRFYRSIHLKAWYKLGAGRPSTSLETLNTHTPFRPKSQFCPRWQNATLETFENKVNYEVEKILASKKQQWQPNLTREERQALKELMDNKNIVIKSADKGGAVVVWGYEQYIKEAQRQLQDTNFYTPLKNNPTDSLVNELKMILTEARDDDLISTQELEFLFEPQPRMASLYLLPKVHKGLINTPGRPVISGNETLLEPISKYVDFFIKPLLPSLPAYIQDTTDVLCQIRDHSFIGPDALLATMDVEALYTNIAHDQGLAALKHFLDKRPSPQSPPTDFLVKLTDWTLNNNIFLFQDKLFKQVKGCAMGACFSPSYAGLFMGKWEEDVVFSDTNTFRDKIIWWARYIDDVILWWGGTEGELLTFHRYLNAANENVKLSLDYSKEKINFLDLNIYKDSFGYLHSSIYRKETHKNTVLSAKSFHPPSLIKNIPFGQFQRLRRICDDAHDFNEKSMDMYNRFLQRGYSPKTLDSALERATSIERGTLLIRKPTVPKQDRVFFTTRYSTEAPSIVNVIKNNWDLLKCDSSLRNIFDEQPIVSYRRAPTLKDRLVRSYMPAKEKNTWIPIAPKGTYKCGHCSVCDIVSKAKGYTHPVTLHTYATNHFINCKTTHVIYILECALCEAFYVGRTKRRLQDRLAEHRYAARIGNCDYAMSRHFKETHSDRMVTFTALGIDCVPLTPRRGDREKILNQKENRWIYKLKATSPPGLNDCFEMGAFL